MPALFPLAEYWPFYLGFIAFVLGILALDLGVFHRHAHEVSIREAAIWSAIWVLLALCFAWLLHQYCLWKFSVDPRLLAAPGFDPTAAARQTTLEFLTGYVVEKSLAVDNVFVFVVLFGYFAIPPKYQHRVLFFGIIGALVFRIIFIALGAFLIQYKWVVIVFGIFLLFTGVKILLSSDHTIDPGNNALMRLLRRLLPITPEIHGSRFFVTINNKLHATPLFVALCFIEFSDIIFAVDSVPAIFAITKEPFIVLTSNVFAILGLRAMYFLLAGVVHKFRFLKYGLGIVLIFVGLKMVWLNEAFHGKFPISWSLAIISGVIGASILLSFLFPAKAETDFEDPTTPQK